MTLSSYLNISMHSNYIYYNMYTHKEMQRFNEFHNLNIPYNSESIVNQVNYVTACLSNNTFILSFLINNLQINKNQ